MPGASFATVQGDAPDLTAEQLEQLRLEVVALEEAQRDLSSTRMEAWLYRYLPSSFSEAPGDFHRGIYRDMEALLWQKPIEQQGANDALYDQATRRDADLLPDDELEAKQQEDEAAAAAGDDDDDDDLEVYDAAAYAYPRGHGKTTTIIKGLILWVIHNWRKMPHFRGQPPFIVIVCGTDDQARDRALDVRDVLEQNPTLHQDYGPVVPYSREELAALREQGQHVRAQKWTESDFTTRDGVRIVAMGSGSKKVRGLLRADRRPTLILCDDLENDDHVQTEGQRAKLRRWLTRALIPTGIEGRLLSIVVGTILHADSLLSRLLSQEYFDGWLKRRYAALYTSEGLPSIDGTVPLWPAMWWRERLLKRRRKIGSIAFAQEYLNQPIDDETALFRQEWLRAALRRGKGAGFLYSPPSRVPFDLVLSTWDPVKLEERAEDAAAYQLVVTAWDLGIVDSEKRAQSTDSDYSVGITVCLTLDDRLEVRRVYRARGLTPAQLRARVVAEQAIIDADYVVVENNQAQKLHEIELRDAPGLKGRVIGHTTTKRKHSVYEGVPSLSMMFELNRVDLCWRNRRELDKLHDLERELHGLGSEAHDDTVMALWMAVVIIRRWQRVRDARRRKLIGAPPLTWTTPYPEKPQAEAA